jgi:Domain of unknown function (DUF4476)
MKNKLILIFFTLGFVCNVFAQQATGALTIFSEDGDKFFLILNGEKQNNIAQTNLRIEDLPQPYYSAKIIFENKTLGEISKKNLMVADVDGNFLDVTYKIKHDKEGMPKMASIPYSSVPVQKGYVAPKNVYVMHYGVPQTDVITQTTTTTTTIGTPATNANINVGGINMNVTINDPFATETIQTTTTTTTNNNVNNNSQNQTSCTNANAMASGNFSSAVTTIKKQSFEDGKLTTARQIANTNCLNTNQIIEICKLFSYEQSKLDFAKFAYHHCVDDQNYFKVNNVFQFSSSTDELNEFIDAK